VAEALENNAWVSDIQGGLSMIGLLEYLHLWDGLREVALSQDDDQHIWRFDASGTYSAKSTYQAFFYGSVTFEPWQHLWKTWAPERCKFFIWLAIKNRCWTADQLAHRGLSHLERCPLCDQEEETIQHLLTNCVFSRQIWFIILSPMEMDEAVPQ